MSELDGVRQAVEAACNEVTQAKSACERAQMVAGDKRNAFAELGLEGVAEVIDNVSDVLSASIGQLHSAYGSCDEAVSGLSGITDQTKVSETVSALSGAVAKLTAVGQETRAAGARANDALEQAQQSEVEPVANAVMAAIGAIEQANASVESAKSSADAHRNSTNSAGQLAAAGGGQTAVARPIASTSPGLNATPLDAVPPRNREPIAKLGDPAEPPQLGPDDTSVHQAELKSNDDGDLKMSTPRRFSRSFSRGAGDLSKAGKEQVQAAEATMSGYKPSPPKGDTHASVGVPSQAEISAPSGDNQSMADPVGTLVLGTAVGFKAAGMIIGKMRSSKRG